MLHPVGGQVVKVELSSAGFLLPVGGDPQQVSTYKPVNLCVHRGDYVDFNDIGGHEWRWGSFDGMPVQVFSRTPESSTAFYSADNGTNVGSQWAPQQINASEELLMRSTLATGPDATDICPGGYMQHIFQGLTIQPDQDVTLRTATGLAKVRVTCPGPSYGRCKGALSVDASLKGRKTVLGAAAFDVQPATSASVEMKVSSANVKLVQQAKTLAAHVSADAKDDPKADARANPGVPVQAKVTEGTIRLKPDRPPAKKKNKASKKGDKDKDGLPDSWEKRFGLSPKSRKDAKKDKDKDGLSNLREFKLKTNPKKKDSDGDGYSDGQEDKAGTSPTDSTSHPPPPPPPDADGDGKPDSADNCPGAGNPGQPNSDGDTQGDACDADDDNDGRGDGSDNCQTLSNAGQANADGDDEGDACDTDDDNDGRVDPSDNCSLAHNTGQANTDANLPGGDALGDACDTDDDADGDADDADNCSLTPNADQQNSDATLPGGDALGDA
ncbi:MAG TPA: thrombospondin type 3 repeat-containing protein, partial [Thermoleophilaceae bacterium]